MNPVYGEIVKTFKHQKSHIKRSNFQQFMMSERSNVKKLRNAHLHLEETFIHEIVEELEKNCPRSKATQDYSEIQELKTVTQRKLINVYAYNNVKEADAEKLPSDSGGNGSGDILDSSKRLVIVFDSVDVAPQKGSYFSNIDANERDESEARRDMGGSDHDGRDIGGRETGWNDTNGRDTDGSDTIGKDTDGSDTTGSDTGGRDNCERDTGGNDTGERDTGGGDLVGRNTGWSDTEGKNAGGNDTGGSRKLMCQTNQETVTMVSIANGRAYVSRTSSKKSFHLQTKCRKIMSGVYKFIIVE
ncbi:uncharacterized protein LOC123530125 [Mercenaria mercenaria]|uniref:uncharacterized protein LOC123530125 n=1 Tax=Mercenaria mercenaria TaxID=6596 RepID=UPI00234E6FBB|nr:uncharacterized protein LOC123530125 [Mercenaria mercenaria]